MSAFVLLHGFTGAPECWDEVVRRLPQSATVLRPAIYGHRGRDEESSSFLDEVDRLARVVSEANFGGAHLAGYSLGARLALWLARRHGPLFSSVTLIGCHPGLTSAAERAARIAADELWIERLEQGIDTFVSGWQTQGLFATQASVAPERRARQAQVRRAHAARGLAASLRVLGLGAMPAAGTLAELSLPVTLITGSRDAKFTELARAMSEQSASATHVVVDGAGHNLPLEAPERVATILSSAGDSKP